MRDPYRREKFGCFEVNFSWDPSFDGRTFSIRVPGQWYTGLRPLDDFGAVEKECRDLRVRFGSAESLLVLGPDTMRHIDDLEQWLLKMRGGPGEQGGRR